MSFLLALTLICALLFGVSVIMRTLVGAIGGATPDWGPARHAAQIGEARLAVVGLDREYRELLRR